MSPNAWARRFPKNNRGDEDHSLPSPESDRQVLSVKHPIRALTILSGVDPVWQPAPLTAVKSRCIAVPSHWHQMARQFLKVIACEIAFREITHLAAGCPNLLDLEFITQGLHDVPRTGGSRIQGCIDAVPEGKYEAILLGYGLCGYLIRGLTARHTKLVIPRAHDCITFFLGSKERYAQVAQERVGTYFYTSGWLECLRRRGEKAQPGDATYLPTRAGIGGNVHEAYEGWVKKYGVERAQYLLAQIDKWTEHYTHGALIDFDFARPLRLDEQVKQVCAQRGWRFEEMPGDLGLLRRWLAGDWSEKDFLILEPGESVGASYDDAILTAQVESDLCPTS